MVKTFKDFISKDENVPKNLDEHGIVMGIKKMKSPKEKPLKESMEDFEHDHKYDHYDHEILTKNWGEHSQGTNKGLIALRRYTEDSGPFNRILARHPHKYAHAGLSPHEHSEVFGETNVAGIESSPHKLRNTVAHLDSQFKPTNGHVTVYSGISGDHAEKIKDALSHGNGVHSNRYTSTSLSPVVAHEFAEDRSSSSQPRHIMKIDVPDGHPHVYVPAQLNTHYNPHMQGEREVLLPRHTLFRHTGKIDEYNHDDGGNPRLFVHHMEAVHPDDHHKFNHHVFHKGENVPEDAHDDEKVLKDKNNKETDDLLKALHP